MLWTTLSIFMLRIPIFHHDLGAEKISPLFVAFVSATLNLGFKTYLYTCTRVRPNQAEVSKVDYSSKAKGSNVREAG
jgi:hypothetical protein